MIQKPNNWDSVKEFSERKKLPVDGYVCRIKNAVVRPTSGSDRLCVLFDIDEGDYAGFYADDYASNQREDKKWKGVMSIFLPTNDGSDSDETTKRILKGFVTAVEQSNHGYVWSWDESTLKGKEIGIIFRNEQWEWNGKSGWSARPFRATTADKIRSGDYTLPSEKALKNAPAVAAVDFSVLDDNDTELPF